MSRVICRKQTPHSYLKFHIIVRDSHIYMSHERQYIWKKNSRVICRKPNDIDVLMCKKKEIIMRMSLIWLTRSFESVPWLRYIDLDSYLLRQAQYICFMTHFLIMEWGVKGGTCAWFFSHVTQIRRIHKRDVTSADVSFICGGAYDGSLLIYLNESRTIIICRKPSISISWHTFKWVSESNEGHVH